MPLPALQPYPEPKPFLLPNAAYRKEQRLREQREKKANEKMLAAEAAAGAGALPARPIPTAPPAVASSFVPKPAAEPTFSMGKLGGILAARKRLDPTDTRLRDPAFAYRATSSPLIGPD